MSYYNTTNVKGEALKREWKGKETQAQKVFIFFRQHSTRAYIPDEVMRYLDLPNVPLTSIRRCITDLTKSGDLIKMQTKKLGMYGKQSHCWRYNTRRELIGEDMEQKAPVCEEQTKALHDVLKEHCE